LRLSSLQLFIYKLHPIHLDFHLLVYPQIYLYVDHPGLPLHYAVIEGSAEAYPTFSNERRFAHAETVSPPSWQACRQLIGGLALVELGVLQFLKLQFGFDWPQMWPLSLAIPGLAWMLSTLFDISKCTKE
jgi:hypothetical protein